MSTRNAPISETDLQAKGWKLTPDGRSMVWDKATAPKIDNTPLTEIPKEVHPQLRAIENVLKACQIPFEREVEFHPTKKWRFDIAVPSLMLCIEYEGIFSKKSRHTNVKGYTEDATKYNAATLLGWKVLRYTAKNYKDFVTDIKLIIK